MCFFDLLLFFWVSFFWEGERCIIYNWQLQTLAIYNYWTTTEDNI